MKTSAMNHDVLPGEPCAAKKPERIAYVFQGGGALGAYQAGVAEGLLRQNIQPHWVVGTSIGAINAALIAGNAPEDRLPALEQFWQRVTVPGAWPNSNVPPMGIFTSGVPGFFRPNPQAWLTPTLNPQLSFYSVSELRQTLAELVDIERLNNGEVRISVGAVNVHNAQMCYFDSREDTLTLDHILASGALPPAFPPVEINGQHYWDGGIMSNTPIEHVIDDQPRRNTLIFAATLWHKQAPVPSNMAEVMTRQKDLQYVSRVEGHLERYREEHRMRHIISSLIEHLPDTLRDQPDIQQMADWGCMTQMHVARLYAPMLPNEGQFKDVDFSAPGVRARIEAGKRDAQRMVSWAPWTGCFNPLEGVLVHELPPEALDSSA